MASRETLSWPKAIRPDPIGCGEVHEEGVSLPAFLPLVHDAEGLVDGVYLSIKDLLVGAMRVCVCAVLYLLARCPDG